MSEGLTSLGLSAFCYCPSLTEGYIPGGVTSVHNAFSRCTGLKRLQIGSKDSAPGVTLIKNCGIVDCKNIEKCRCTDIYGTPTAHFEVPQIVNDFDDLAIDYIGTIDKETEFVYYTSLNNKRLHKYKRRANIQKPFVWIDVTPNENGMYDGFIFNAPLIKVISIVAVFKDIR